MSTREIKGSIWHVCISILEIYCPFFSTLHIAKSTSNKLFFKKLRNYQVPLYQMITLFALIT
jgi:hypothetical protein